MNASRTKRHIGLLLIVFSLAGSSGCAFGTRHATLTYPPGARDGGALDASATADEAGTSRCCNVVLAVTDRRAKTERIGNVRNTFGMDTANVVTKDDIQSWVEGAFTQELSSVGYTVLPVGSAASSDQAIRLNAEITKVHCDIYMRYDGRVSMAVELSRHDTPAFEKQYEGSGSVGLNWAATAKSYAESLALALQDAISEVIADLAQYHDP